MKQRCRLPDVDDAMLGYATGRASARRCKVKLVACSDALRCSHCARQLPCRGVEVDHEPPAMLPVSITRPANVCMHMPSMSAELLLWHPAYCGTLWPVPVPLPPDQ